MVDELPRQTAIRELYEVTGLAAPAEQPEFFETTVYHPDRHHALAPRYVMSKSVPSKNIILDSDVEVVLF